LTVLGPISEAIRATALTGNGWFEEDCDWAFPYLALGLEAFESNAARAAEMHQAAVRTVQKYHPQHAALLGVAPNTMAAGHG
jgi:hypothetical protein